MKLQLRYSQNLTTPQPNALIKKRLFTIFNTDWC